MRKQNYLSIILVSTVAILSTALLIAQRFEGGTQVIATMGDEEFRRGEVVHANQPELLTYGSAQIWMDKNTDVKLVDGSDEWVTINVVQGRVVAIGQLTVETRELKTVIDGTTSFVHYSWQDRIEIASIDGRTYLHRVDEQIDLSAQSLSTTTLEPFVDEYIEFDPSKSSAASFYYQALK